MSHQQREKKMFGEPNAQRANSISLTLYHLFHGSNTVVTSTIGCKSFQTGVAVSQVYLLARILQHMVSRPHCAISCSLPVFTSEQTF